MTKEELTKALELHKLWLNGDEKGVKADLSYATLSYATLSNATLRYATLSNATLRNATLRNADLCNADLSYADLSYADLSYADLSCADLSYADLSNADLSCADLRNATLRGANLDFSCLPLWCGSLTAHFDDKQLIQIAYHLVRAGLQSKNASDETKAELSKLIDFANKFHRVGECGKIKKIESE